MIERIPGSAAAAPAYRLSGTMPGMHFATPSFSRVTYRFDQRRVLACMLFAALLAAAMTFAALDPAQRHNGPVDLIAMSVATAGAVILLAIAVGMGLPMLLWRGPVVSIDAFGILDRRIFPFALPWHVVKDVRTLDADGYRIAVEIDPTASFRPADFVPRRSRWMLASSPGLTPVVDTFFLRTASGNRLLDILMPVTAFAPLDLNELPVSEETRVADRKAGARHRYRILAVAAAVIGLPLAASVYLIAV